RGATLLACRRSRCQRAALARAFARRARGQRTRACAHRGGARQAHPEEENRLPVADGRQPFSEGDRRAGGCDSVHCRSAAAPRRPRTSPPSRSSATRSAMKIAPCRQIENVLAHGDVETDALVAASLAPHLQSCPTCRRHQRTWALVRESAFSANDVLDDLTRARVLGRVQARLGAPAARASGPERRTRPLGTRLAWSLAFATVAILAFVLGTR